MKTLYTILAVLAFAFMTSAPKEVGAQTVFAHDTLITTGNTGPNQTDTLPVGNLSGLGPVSVRVVTQRNSTGITTLQIPGSGKFELLSSYSTVSAPAYYHSMRNIQSSPEVIATWPTSPGAAGTYVPMDKDTVQLLLSEIPGGITLSNLVINGVAVYTGIDTVIGGSLNQFVIIQRNNTGFHGTQSFYDILVTGPNVAPVTWAQQPQASAISEGAFLTWATATEMNANFFAIERSTGTGFSEVGQVQCAGIGQSYEYTDLTNISGVVYYRLKQVDLNGSYLYSEIAEVTLSGSKNISIYPCPATSAELTFSSTQKGSIQIFDSQGERVTDMAVDVGENFLSSNLPEVGVFYYLYQGLDGTIQKGKFVVVN